MPLIRKKAKAPMSRAAESEGEPPSLAIALDVQRKSRPKKMAQGGMPQPAMAEERAGSVAEAIMHRRKMMADGGEVDIDSNGQEDPANPNAYDDQNMDAAMKELYDDDQLMDQPMDSNQHGDILSDEDANDLVSKIRRQAKLRDR